MKRIKENLFPCYQYELLSREPGILHFVSSGEGKEHSNLSLALPEGAGNRKLLAEAMGFDPDQLTLGEQVHSAGVAVVGENERGKGGRTDFSRIPATDALITDRPGICLMILTADCVPVLLYDPQRRVIAAVHAGWRGTVARITGHTVEMMCRRWQCRPGDIRAGIGPSIGKCCFEVGKEVGERFEQAGMKEIAERAGEKFHIDLWEANKMQLLAAGLAERNIEVAGICTACRPDLFFSYRKGAVGFRFGSGIMLK